jgi:hypothetical protein
LQVAALEQHEDLPPSTNGRQTKPSLAQHSLLQHLTVVLQQKPPQQRCGLVELEGQGLELEQDVTDVRAATEIEFERGRLLHVQVWHDNRDGTAGICSNLLTDALGLEVQCGGALPVNKPLC